MADEATTLEVPLEIPSEVNSGDDRFIRRFLWAPYLAIGAILVALAIASFLEYRQKTKAQRDKTSNAHPFFSSNKKSRYKVTMNKDGPPRSKTPDALPSVSQLIDVYYQKGKQSDLRSSNLSGSTSPKVAFLYRSLNRLPEKSANDANPLPEKTANDGSRSSPDSAVDVTNNVSSEDSQTPSTNCDYVPLISNHKAFNQNHQEKMTLDRHVREADISIAVAENPLRRKQQYNDNEDYVSTITDAKHRSQLSLGMVNNYRSQLPVGVEDGINHSVSMNSGSISQKIESKELTHPYDKPLYIYTDDDLYSLSNSNHLNKMKYTGKFSIPTPDHPPYHIRTFPTQLLNDVAMERQQYGCYLESFAAPSRQQNITHSRILELDAQRLNENEYQGIHRKESYEQYDVNMKNEYQKDHHLDGRNYSNNENARSIPNHNVNDYHDTGYQVSRENSPADDPFPRKDAKCFINITLL